MVEISADYLYNISLLSEVLSLRLWFLKIALIMLLPLTSNTNKGTYVDSIDSLYNQWYALTIACYSCRWCIYFVVIFPPFVIIWIESLTRKCITIHVILMRRPRDGLGYKWRSSTGGCGGGRGCVKRLPSTKRINTQETVYHRSPHMLGISATDPYDVKSCPTSVHCGVRTMPHVGFY